MPFTAADREALIQRYADGPRRLRAAFGAVPAEARQWRPAPGEWSAHEVVCHCADSETHAASRIRILASEKEPLHGRGLAPHLRRASGDPRAPDRRQRGGLVVSGHGTIRLSVGGLAAHPRLPATAGDLPPVVLVHGAANCAGVWTFWQDRLAEHGFPSGRRRS